MLRTRTSAAAGLAAWLVLGLAGARLASARAGAEFLLLEIPASSLAISAGAAADGGSENLIRNPAGILGATRPGLAFTHDMAFDDFAYEQIEGVLPQVWDGSLAGRLLFARALGFTRWNDAGEADGVVDYHDALLQLAYARAFSPSVHAGLSGKFFQNRLADADTWGGAVDLGFRWRTPWPFLAVGAAVLNAGGRRAFQAQADPLPLLGLAGVEAAFSPWAGQTVRLVADASQDLNAAGRTHASFGMECGLWQTVFLRGGLRLEDELGRLSLGAGLRLGAWGLDYAFQSFDFLGQAHHFTLSFEFLPAPEKPVVVEPRSSTAPGQAAGLPAAGEKLKPVNASAPRELTAQGREYAGQIQFKPPALDPAVREWAFQIQDENGRAVKTFAGAHTPPKSLEWDGRNDAGQPVPPDVKYRYVILSDGNSSAAHELPALQPVLKFRFADNAAPITRVRFKFKNRPETQAWSLVIYPEGAEAPVRTLGKAGALPPEIRWDGRDSQGRAAATSRVYRYVLNVRFADQSEMSVSDRILPVPARKLKDTPGRKNILVPGILFDFNSAVLKPEMTDKILAVAEVLEENGTNGRAQCEGHADEIGGAAYNRRLSLIRAQMVTDFLGRQAGVKAQTVRSRGFGKIKPENRLHTEAGRQRNRRVEIRLSLQRR